VDEGTQPPRRGFLARALGRRAPGVPAPPATEPPVVEPTPPADADWLEAPIEQFEGRLAEILQRAGDDLYAQVERDLARTEERLRQTEERLELHVAERLEGAVAEVRVQGDAQLAEEVERVREAVETPLATIRKASSDAVQRAHDSSARAEESASKAAAQIEAAAEKLGARARRQELKLVREETSKRMKGALDRLEHQADLRMAEILAARAQTEDMLARVDERVTAAVGAANELDRRLDATAERLSAAESRAGAATSLVAEAATRLEDAVARVEQAEQRVLELAERAAAAAQRIAQLGEFAERAADWEGRMEAATRSEADAAKRISDAERRLLGRIDSGGSSS